MTPQELRDLANSNEYEKVINLLRIAATEGKYFTEFKEVSSLTTRQLEKEGFKITYPRSTDDKPGYTCVSFE